MFASIASIAFLLTVPFYTNQKRIELIPSGENMLFRVDTKGVVVSGTYLVEDSNNNYDPARDSDIKKGDIIIRANKKNIQSIDDLLISIEKQTQVDVQINRKGKILDKSLEIHYINQIPRTGLYVKDKVIGVGTMTYIDPTNMIYASLGHEVIDNDTQSIVEYRGGASYYNSVTGIKKGVNHHPGEKISNTEMTDAFGNIVSISNKGLFGKYQKSLSGRKSYPIALKDEVKKGKAEILTCVNGNEVKSYDVEITEIKKQDEQGIKGLTFKIVDQELIDIAGGVYAGMSGSPIIQNDHLIGAVTHVLVDNIKYGYGLFIDNMYTYQYNNL